MKLLSLLALLVLTGCTLPALKGGKSSFVSASGIAGDIAQSENPKSESTQDYDRTTETKDGKTVVKEKVHTRLGAAQKDTGREIAAKLSSLKGVVWVGILLFIFGAASAVYPPLKVIVGSLTTSLVCAAAGIALIVLPSLIVGNEILILCVGGGVVIIYWFAHRHGHAKGQLTQLLK
jgi:hypothetical protein